MDKPTSGYVCAEIRAAANAFTDSDVAQALIKSDPQRAITLAYQAGAVDMRNQWLAFAFEQGWIEEYSETLPEGAELADEQGR